MWYLERGKFDMLGWMYCAYQLFRLPCFWFLTCLLAVFGGLRFADDNIRSRI